MSLVPEAAFKTISIGTPCVGKENNSFTTLGLFKEKHVEKQAQEQKLYPSLSFGNTPIMSILHYSKKTPERQEVLETFIWGAQPVMYLNEEKTK